MGTGDVVFYAVWGVAFGIALLAFLWRPLSLVVEFVWFAVDVEWYLLTVWIVGYLRFCAASDTVAELMSECRGARGLIKRAIVFWIFTCTAVSRSHWARVIEWRKMLAERRENKT